MAWSLVQRPPADRRRVPRCYWSFTASFLGTTILSVHRQINEMLCFMIEILPFPESFRHCSKEKTFNHSRSRYSDQILIKKDFFFPSIPTRTDVTSSGRKLDTVLPRRRRVNLSFKLRLPHRAAYRRFVRKWRLGWPGPVMVPLLACAASPCTTNSFLTFSQNVTVS